MSLTAARVGRWEAVDGVQPAVILDGFFESEAPIQQHPRVQEALA